MINIEVKRMAKKTTDASLNLDSILFNCRDYLRAARNSGSFFEKRDMMLTLVFLRFIGEKYDDGVEKLKDDLKKQGLDPEDPEIKKAFIDDPTFTDGTFYLPKEARWETIINTPATNLNSTLDKALKAISDSSEDLKGCFVEGTFTSRNLGSNDIKKIVDEVNKISHKKFGEEKDLIGRVYEYFLKEFAVSSSIRSFPVPVRRHQNAKKHRGKATFAPMMGWIMGLEPTIFRATI